MCGGKWVFINRFPTLRGTESSPALSPSLPRGPELLLLPKQLQAKIVPRSSPFPYLSLSQSCTQISILFWNVLLWVSESPSSGSNSLLQDLGCATLSLQVAVQENVLSYTGSWWSPGKHTSQESDFSVCLSEKQKYLLSQVLEVSIVP